MKVALPFRMTVEGRKVGRIARNAGSFPRKELGEALRIGPKNWYKAPVPHQALSGPRLFYEKPLSSVACGDADGWALRCSLCVQAMLTY